MRHMTRYIASVFTLIVVIVAIPFLAAPNANAEPREIVTVPLDRAEALGTRIAADPEIKTDGEASIRVVTQWPTVINLAEVIGPSVAPATLIYEADIRSQDLLGNAYLEIWCHFGDQGRYFGRGLDSTVTGTTDWTKLSVDFRLEDGQRPTLVTLNLVIEGEGVVWVDRPRLLYEPLP